MQADRLGHVLEHLIYREVAKQEETFLMLRFKELMQDMPPPPGWRTKKGPGRPRNVRPGRKEEFTWRAMVLVHLLKTLHGLTNCETESHLRANSDLCERMGLPRVPSEATIRRAFKRFPEAWLKKVNQALLEPERGVRGRPPRKRAGLDRSGMRFQGPGSWLGPSTRSVGRWDSGFWCTIRGWG